jgi:hypothetical protein
MNVVTIRDGLKHRVVSVEADPRIVLTSCGIRVARIEGPPDVNSKYQREHRHDWTISRCGAC